MTLRAWAPTRPRWSDSTRERAAAVNQLLTGAVTLVAYVIVGAAGVPGDAGLRLRALALMFVITGLAIVVPWNRMPPDALLVLPLLDGLSITMLEVSAPGAGLGYLWVLPCLWLSSSFRGRGVVISIITATGCIWVAGIVLSEEGARPAPVILPIVLAVVSLIAHRYARYTRAQRALLAHQGESLKAAVAHTRRQEAFVREILDAVDFGVVRFDDAGATVVANEAHARLLAPVEGTGGAGGADGADGERAVYAADGVTRIPPAEEPVVRAARGERFDETLVWHGAPGGPRRALSMSARTLPATAGATAGGLVVSRDVTSEVLALRAREDLVASVSHELRTPLTSILGYVDLALDADDLPASTRANLEVIQRNAERLLHIVADLLAVAADARDGISLTYHREATDVGELVTAAVDAMRTQADARGIRIDASGVEAAVAWIDPLRLRQVVDNLLGNAVKYHHDGGLVEVGVTGDVDHVWVVVRDDGPGIGADDVPRLFDRFFRAERVRHTSTHGSGLGLAISREMMRAQGGDITVQTAVGEGSTFIVRVPRHSGEG